jgi:hypothetical protein
LKQAAENAMQKTNSHASRNVDDISAHIIHSVFLMPFLLVSGKLLGVQPHSADDSRRWSVT